MRHAGNKMDRHFTQRFVARIKFCCANTNRETFANFNTVYNIPLFIVNVKITNTCKGSQSLMCIK